MSKGFEQTVEVDIAAINTQRAIVLVAHMAALLPVASLSTLLAWSVLLLVMVSLVFHFRQLRQQRWQQLLLLPGGSILLLDRANEAFPAELLVCTLCAAQVLVLEIRVAGNQLQLPVFRWFQQQAYRQLRCHLLKYPPVDASALRLSGQHAMPNGHRRGSGTVF